MTAAATANANTDKSTILTEPIIVAYLNQFFGTEEEFTASDLKGTREYRVLIYAEQLWDNH